MIIFKERHYKYEKNFNSIHVDSHPLQGIKDMQFRGTARQGLTNTVKTYVDPLSSLSPLETLKTDDKNDSFKSKIPIDIEPWSSKRLNILMTYTTSEKLSIISSFLSNKPNEEFRILNKQTTSSIVDKVKIRLEQLDLYEEEIRETSNLSVQQFTDKIFELQNALKMSWQDEHRVKALQIVIQSTKLLSESNVPQFFPSKFVLVTDLVDNFGKYVLERLKLKSAYTPRGAKVPIPLPENFTESEVPESAKETARNWLYKVSSIRELVARIYVEATLLPCYQFFNRAAISSILLRVIKSARGIGDPLLATYARAYVVRVGISIDPYKKDYIEVAFGDTLQSLTVCRATDSYLRLFVPAIDWILSCLCASVNDIQLDAIIDKIEGTKSPLLWHSALNSLSTTYIEKRALKFAEVINDLPDGMYPKFGMYKQLGLCVSLSFSPGRDKAVQLMKVVWKYISKLSDPRQFIECADAWSGFLAMHFDNTYVNRFIGHIAKEMIRDNVYREYYIQLQSILGKLISYNCDFENLFSAPEFSQFLSLFDKDHVVLDVRQMVLDRFFSVQGDNMVSDPVVIQGCMRLLKEMYDSLNSLSVADNRKTVSKLVLLLLNRIRFEGRNVERELSLLTQFRSMFGTMDIVIYHIVERVNSLTMRVRSLRPDKEHNESSSSFVRACMAFSFITIPSIEEPLLAIRLYTSTGQVALINSCLGQAESCLKEAIHLLSKLDTEYKGAEGHGIEPGLVGELAANIASTLLMCPDIESLMDDEETNQGQKILYMVRGLVNAVKICPVLKSEVPDSPKTQVKGEILVKILLVLSAFGQPEYPYHAGKTDSNDIIYGGSDRFLQVVSELFKLVVSLIGSLNNERSNGLLKEVLSAVAMIEEEDQTAAYTD